MFLVLGIGSIRARRWARAIILALSWMWLIVGVMTSIGLVAMSPHMFDALPQEQASMKPMIIGCMSVFLGLFLLFFRWFSFSSIAGRMCGPSSKRSMRFPDGRMPSRSLCSSSLSGCFPVPSP
jgi:hypothetical protein